MGTDINGWIEIPLTPDSSLGLGWCAIINIGLLLDRDYALFGSLFGVRNRTDFEPVAPARGLPADASAEVQQQFYSEPEGGFHSPTWISLAELRKVNWEERALDGMARGYREGESESYFGKSIERTDPRRKEGETWIEKDVFVKGDKDMLFRVEKITRRQALGDSGRLVLDLMEVLAKRYGDANVRLVVYFDN